MIERLFRIGKIKFCFCCMLAVLGASAATVVYEATPDELNALAAHRKAYGRFCDSIADLIDTCQ